MKRFTKRDIALRNTKSVVTQTPDSMPESPAPIKTPTIKKDSQLTKTAQKLVAKGYARLPAETKIDNPVDISLDILASMGCTISQKPKDYSLIDIQTDTETIENPNIETPNVTGIKNKQITAKKMFPNTNDSFYELDEEPPRGFRKYREDIEKAKIFPDTTEVTVDIINNKGNLKHFR